MQFIGQVSVFYSSGILAHSQQRSPTQSLLTPWHWASKYVMSLAHCSKTFKWAWNTVLWKNRKAVCSAFDTFFYVFAHTFFICGPCSTEEACVRAFVCVSSRLSTCLLLNVTLRAATFHINAEQREPQKHINTHCCVLCERGWEGFKVFFSSSPRR